MSLKGLHVPFGASWYPNLRAGLLTFPAGRHDDQVDALGLVGQLLDKMADGRKPKKPDTAAPEAYRSQIDDVYRDYTQSSVKLM